MQRHNKKRRLLHSASSIGCGIYRWLGTAVPPSALSTKFAESGWPVSWQDAGRLSGLPVQSGSANAGMAIATAIAAITRATVRTIIMRFTVFHLLVSWLWS